MSRIASREPTDPPLRGIHSLADLLWVVNTGHGPAAHWFARPGRDDPHHDHLRDAAGTARYLTDHHVAVPADPPTASDLADLAAIRSMVRGLLAGGDGWTQAVRDVRARTRFQVDDEGRLRADGEGWAAFVGDLLLPLMEVVRLRDRLRACGNSACGLVFLDESRNRTRRWCDDGGCGNRARARRWRCRGGNATRDRADVGRP